MLDRTKREGSLLITVVLAALNLIAFNVLVSGWSTARVDLTADRQFSISDATRRVLDTLDEDVTIYGYFSRRTHPKLSPLVPQIVDLLDEYRAVSGGRVHVEILDPGENDDAAQEAGDRYGVRSTPFQLASKYETGIVNAYFALVVRYGDRYERYGFEDIIAVEPTPDGDIDVRLRNLEYDLTRAIRKVSSEFRSSLDLFEALDGPVRLTAIVTPGDLPEIFAGVPEAVREAARELQDNGGEKFVFEEIDPSGDEALQDDLYRRYGARPMGLGLFGDESFYLYALLEVGGRLEQVVLTDPETSAADVREAVEKSVRRQTPGALRTVGVVAPAPPELPPEVLMQFQMQGRQPPTPPPEFEEIQRYLEADYVVKKVDLGAEGGVPYDVDLLLVMKPKDFGELELYHLDQFLMRGGRVVLSAGNVEVDFSDSGLRVSPLETGLGEWLAHHGVTIGKELVLDDRNQSLPIPEVRQTPLGPMRTWVMAPYPYLVQVRDDGFVNPDVAATLDAVGIYWGNPLTVDSEATGEIEVEPVLRSSERSWVSDDLTEVAYVDYQVPEDGLGPQWLAVSLGGRFETFFGDGPPEGASESAILERSPDTRMVVIGNSEFLSDFVARALGRVEGGFFLENLRFMENLIDWTTLDNDMIGIRSRGAAARRLQRTEPGEQVALEAVNYLVPAVLLVVVALGRIWRRRNTTALYAPVQPEPREAAR